MIIKPKEIIFDRPSEDRIHCSMSINFIGEKPFDMPYDKFINNFPLDVENVGNTLQYNSKIIDGPRLFCKKKSNLTNVRGFNKIYVKAGKETVSPFFIKPLPLIQVGLYCFICGAVGPSHHNENCRNPTIASLSFTVDGILRCYKEEFEKYTYIEETEEVIEEVGTGTDTKTTKKVIKTSLFKSIKT